MGINALLSSSSKELMIAKKSEEGVKEILDILVKAEQQKKEENQILSSEVVEFIKGINRVLSISMLNVFTETQKWLLGFKHYMSLKYWTDYRWYPAMGDKFCSINTILPEI